MKMVLVRWIDARFIEGWYERHDIDSARSIKCVTVGILLNENENDIVVSCHRNEDHIAGAMAIPRGCIKSIKQLKVVKALDELGEK